MLDGFSLSYLVSKIIHILVNDIMKRIDGLDRQLDSLSFEKSVQGYLSGNLRLGWRFIVDFLGVF